ncbi:hypothetical protein L1987_00719 [Smallanthus sonchifolius]|uniref:Uncharacterized protein n=1 Tax=Smallanthus sonchifolius TaxID=185202 RepID=A0ACB9K340_9ASTR|nr:hypothetical protein L1987_00719 [Smallanthus sonchifolius]
MFVLVHYIVLEEKQHDVVRLFLILKFGCAGYLHPDIFTLGCDSQLKFLTYRNNIQIPDDDLCSLVYFTLGLFLKYC